jgi:hypothetical protein
MLLRAIDAGRRVPTGSLVQPELIVRASTAVALRA